MHELCRACEAGFAFHGDEKFLFDFRCYCSRGSGAADGQFFERNAMQAVAPAEVGGLDRVNACVQVEFAAGSAKFLNFQFFALGGVLLFGYLLHQPNHFFNCAAGNIEELNSHAKSRIAADDDSVHPDFGFVANP